MIARTWLVLAIDGQHERTEGTDERALDCGGGVDLTLPPYLGVWLAPNGAYYHLYSDYPESHHERFGWEKS